MPRPHAPPMPGSSTDIRGKEGAHCAPTFYLLPTAYQEFGRGSTDSTTSSANGSDSSYRPFPPASPGQSRKRPATDSRPVVARDDFALPPPPTRSRNIIQMKPRDTAVGERSQEGTNAVVQSRSMHSHAQSSSRRNQKGAGNTAAGRKIARKTAHSLIERRRRSKMNEEFGVLKDMIPACEGEEMHKLAILQASIDYLRYLEQCVADLKAQNASPWTQPPRPTIPQSTQADEDEDEDNDEMEDENEAPASTLVTSAPDRVGSQVSLPSLSQITSMASNSPSFSAGAGRHYSVSSVSQASFSPYFHSNQTSPALGPQLSHVSTTPASAGPYKDGFGLGSPTLKPIDSARQFSHGAERAPELSEQQHSDSDRLRRSEHELDREATAALLMLNNDRRSWRPEQSRHDSRNGSAGMSVRDLLSS